MAEYAPLADHLRRQPANELMMDFPEIETLTGTLPKSAYRPQYWENAANPDQLNSGARAAYNAGFESFLVRGTVNRVRFVRK